MYTSRDIDNGRYARDLAEYETTGTWPKQPALKTFNSWHQSGKLSYHIPDTENSALKSNPADVESGIGDGRNTLFSNIKTAIETTGGVSVDDAEELDKRIDKFVDDLFKE